MVPLTHQLVATGPRPLFQIVKLQGIRRGAPAQALQAGGPPPARGPGATPCVASTFLKAGWEGCDSSASQRTETLGPCEPPRGACGQREQEVQPHLGTHPVPSAHCPRRHAQGVDNIRRRPADSKHGRSQCACAFTEELNVCLHF